MLIETCLEVILKGERVCVDLILREIVPESGHPNRKGSPSSFVLKPRDCGMASRAWLTVVAFPEQVHESCLCLCSYPWNNSETTSLSIYTEVSKHLIKGMLLPL